MDAENISTALIISVTLNSKNEITLKTLVGITDWRLPAKVP